MKPLNRLPLIGINVVLDGARCGKDRPMETEKIWVVMRHHVLPQGMKRWGVESGGLDRQVVSVGPAMNRKKHCDYGSDRDGDGFHGTRFR